MKYLDLDPQIYKDEEITVTLQAEGRQYNQHRGKTKFSDKTCICFEFKINHTDDPKKRLTRKWLDVMMKKEELHDTLHKTVFEYANNPNVEIETIFNWEWCWVDYFSVISGNRLVVTISYKDEKELKAISEIFKNDKRWCI